MKYLFTKIPHPPQESSERLRDLTNKLEDANRKRQEVEHKLHESQNEYANLESKYRRSVEKESQLQDQISDLQSQLKNQIDAHNQTKVCVVFVVIYFLFIFFFWGGGDWMKKGANIKLCKLKMKNFKRNLVKVSFPRLIKSVLLAEFATVS